MKAIRIHHFGASDVLTEEQTPRPEAGDGEVLIKVHAAGVNPVDYKIRSGEFKKEKIELPTTLGRDVSGVVAGVGRGVAGFRPGDEVYAFLASHGGGYAEYAVAREDEVARKPVSIDHVHAAAVPLAATTAWQALFDHGRLQPGERVLIHGAAGGVGHYAVQLAKAHGAVVIASARAEDAAMLRDLGADQVIDYRSERFEDRTGDIDLVLDLVAGRTQERSWEVLKEGGRLVSTLTQPSARKAARHHAEGTAFKVRPNAGQLRRIAELIDAGKVDVVVEKNLPLAEARRAHDALEHEHIHGKVVLSVDVT
jgi:NADPH:quinone reductase-like Zn-dependent oxidoreductase